MTTAFRKIFVLTVAMALIATTLVAQTAPAQDPLVQVLVQKGVLTSRDAGTITGNAQEQRDRLAQLLREKGVLSASDFNSVRGSLPAGTLVPVTYATQAKPAAPGEAKAAAPTVIPAVAPIRVLQLEPAKPGGLIPDIKLGSGARLKFYGFFKASTIYDTSSPVGSDAPSRGFQNDGGPAGSPEFHLRARETRWGANFEWPDISPKMSLTGKLEMDFLAPFNQTANTIRQNNPRIRLAYVRLDYKPTDKTSVFFLAGQDFTPFGSSTLPNILELANFWEGGFGSLYTRDPQLRVGLTHKFGPVTVAPEFAIAYSGYGLLPGCLNTISIPANALGVGIPAAATTISGSTCGGISTNTASYGERQGADGQRPDIQGRLVFQWQLDHARAVAPAQVIFSAIQGKRTSTILASAIPADAGGVSWRTRYPNGTTIDTDRNGYTAEVQLPTRWVTAIAKYYRGANIAWFASSGQGNAFYNNTFGFTNLTSAVNNIDASSTALFGTNAAGAPSVVPQNPVRAQGGLAQVSFPLSRIFNADPAGRNAGWTMSGFLGSDSAFAKDMIKTSVTNPRNKSYVFGANLLYKMNQFVTFGLEESYYGSSELTNINNYRTYTAAPCSVAVPCVLPGLGAANIQGTTIVGAILAPNPFGVGTAATYRGNFAAKWHDLRTEFATIFTF